MTAVLDSNRQVFFVGVTPPTGDYNYLDNKPAIDGVTLYSDTTKEDLGLDIVFKYKGQVDTYSDLPTSGNVIGDTWNVKDTGENYCWNGSGWDCLSGSTTVYYNNGTLQSSGSNISIDYTKNNITNMKVSNVENDLHFVSAKLVESTKTTQLSEVVVNKLTQSEYDSTTKKNTELYLITDNPPQLTTNMEQSVSTSSTKYPSSYAVTNALSDKVTKNNSITAGTHTKISYDSKGLVTGGSDIDLTYFGVTASADELNYTDGVTSNIQTQLNGKQPTLPTYDSGKFLTNDGTNLSWSSVDALPSQTGQSGKYLTTNGTTASWSSVEVLPTQTGMSGKYLTTNGTSASWASVDTLPSQTGMSGKYLTTDGSTASWSTVDSLPSQTGNSGKFLTTNGTAASWASIIDNLTFTATDFRTVTTIPSTISFSKAKPTVYYTAGTNTSLTFTTFSCSDTDLTDGTYTWELLCSSSSAITGTTYGASIQYVGNDKTYNPSLAFALIDNARTAHSFAVRMIKNGTTTSWMFCYNYSFKG